MSALPLQPMRLDSEEESTRIKIATTIAILGFILYLPVDYFIAKDKIYNLAQIRAIACLSIASIRYLSQVSSFKNLTKFWSAVFFTSVCVSITACCVAAKGSESYYYEPLALMYVCYSGFLPTTYLISAILFFSMTAFYETTMLVNQMAGSVKEATQQVALLVLASGVGVGFVYANGKLRDREQRAKAKEFAAQQDLATSHASLQAAVENLRQANIKLTEVDVLKNESFANLSHEFRTPIALIRGSIQSLLDQSDLQEGYRKQLSVAEKSSEKLLVMINELLDLTKLDSSIEPVARNCLDLAQILRELTDLIQMHAQKQKISIRFMPSSDSHLLVLGDRKYIERLCTNLISNAIKYTDEGGTIEIDAFPENGRARVVVSDTGVGIKPEDLNRVFLRYVQIPTEGRPSRGGVGIGLAFCKGIVEAHGGQMTLTSVYKQGSKFGFWLPLPSEEDLQNAGKGLTGLIPAKGLARNGLEEWGDVGDSVGSRVDKIVQASEMRVLTRIPMSPDALKVLIVEDNPDLVALMDGMIGGEYNLQWAADGAKGLEMVDTFRPDLVLSDVAMPNMSGEAMIRAIRAQAYGATIPIVVLTAKSLDTDRARLVEAGADHFLVKGFDASELKSVLRTLLKRQVSTRKLAEDERLLALRAMAGGVAHEILNPLNLLGNYSGQLRLYVKKMRNAPSLPEPVTAIVDKQEKAIEGIESNLKRAKSCVEPLRRVSKGTENEAPMEKCSINHVVSDVATAVNTKGDLFTDLQATKDVMAQPNRVQQVLVNLIVNAQQACGDAYPDPIEVRTRDSADGKNVEVTVTDHGPGMNNEILGRIFTPYFTTKATGTGLGLHVCREILTAHGGSLTVASEVGKGTTFIMRIPAAVVS